jgi:putative transposase
MGNKTKLEIALDELLAGKSTEEMVGPDGLLKPLTKSLLERAMNAELTHPLGDGKHEPEGRGSGNSRNGPSRKTVPGDFGSVELGVPRDRNGRVEPKILPKHERRLAGLDAKLLSLSARGLTTRDIQSH